MHGSSLIVIGHSKGGVGKSTLAVHSAVGLFDMGHRVAVIEADDENRTTGEWLPAVEESIPLYAVNTPQEIEQALLHAAATHDFIIADSAGGILDRTRSQARTLLCYCDFFIIPVQPSLKAVRPLARLQELIEEVERERGYPLQARILINGIDRRTKASEEILEAVQAITTIPVFNTMLPRCEQFDNAESYNSVITRMRNANRRAKESMQALLAEVMGELVVSINNRPLPEPSKPTLKSEEPSDEFYEQKIVNV